MHCSEAAFEVTADAAYAAQLLVCVPVHCLHLSLQHGGARGCGSRPPQEDSAAKETLASAPTLATH